MGREPAVLPRTTVQVTRASVKAGSDHVRVSTRVAPAHEAIGRFEALNAIVRDAASRSAEYLDSFRVEGGGE